MTDISGVAKEIERKFLLTGLPSKLEHGETYHAQGVPADLARDTYYNIEHGWLPGDVIQERLTCNTRGQGEYWRAIKAGQGVERIEAQERISLEFFNKLWDLTLGKRVAKIRYCVPERDRAGTWNGVLWEVDRFLDRNLVMAEVEIPSADFNLQMPLWLASYVVKEVTDDPSYLNVNLAK